MLAMQQAARRTPSLFPMIALLIAAFSSPADARRQSPWEDLAAGRTPGDAILAVVALNQQKITLYDAKGPLLRASISSGRDGYETPAGVFSVLQKEEEHYSNRYDDAAMPYMQRITWSGIALHGGPLPGYPASHGCVRLPSGFAKQLFGITKLGLRVVIAPADVAAVPLSHPLLSTLQPPLDAPALQPAGLDLSTVPSGDRLLRLQSIAADAREAAASAAAKADEAKAFARAKEGDQRAATKQLMGAEKVLTRAKKQLAAAERSLSSAKTPAQVSRAQSQKDVAARELEGATAQLETTRRQAQPLFDAAAQARKAADNAAAAQTVAEEQARNARRKLWPVSIFVSRKTGLLYVRQGFEPVMEFAVPLRDPDKPIGTHVFTAGNDGAAIVWQAVSLGTSGGRSKRMRSAPNTTEALAALDRITVPQQVSDLVSESAVSGTSLIISDEGPHKETGPATDFIVVMSDEPQGGLKMRPVEPHVATVSLYRSKPQPQRATRESRLGGGRSFRNPLGADFLPW
ncbi:MAG: L,D-transpeptidase family protein [Hyphomicrobium sp.]